ncbi:MAG: glycine cleavage system protein GcvH [Actinobacteria bacterium]|jgi:glycine cleavage system H protein|nr:glycine cleavage system protein GcvH [Actinomycetota bacterium]NCV96122.1 glycine cleavage system protein GcvH [Actinomycetota bacterium]NCW46657.1 glycine cleavage system protein GcvH [Actinomycetota bacterium]NCW75768.1 glycine cleavage system protein GcvH [Actinomycetota bacterium]NCW93964.1 glycine cleavage system protein GcvH [Actinomycetota bacterium]
MSSVPPHLKYTKEHEWIEEVSPGRYRVGITDYAQGALGDIVYLQMPKVGESISAGKVCGEVESTKSVSEIYAPISGTVTTVNTDLDSAPETINSDPYGKGWLMEVEASSPNQLSELLSPEAYSALTA